MADKGTSRSSGSTGGDKKNPIRPTNGSVLAHWLIVALVLFACTLSAPVECQEQLTVESRQQKDSPSSDNELADTMKYLEKLEKLDQYWSEVARPRFGRSEYKQPALGYRFAAPPASEQRPMARLMYGPRQASGIGGNALLELLSARLAQKYNSNEAY